ncbi:hypothetical protein BKCO1_32000104 [Neofusicoccum parvum]|nr:hypothetical protein BKCO1_32000104 [Neofusicoccum parvum]
MIAHSPKLEGLHLQWSARMRNAGEESINLALYFGRCIANKQPLKLKRLSTINLFARATNVDFNQLVDLEDLEETTFLNSRTCDANSVFVDDTWRFFTLEKPPRGLRMMRTDAVDDHLPAGLDRLYFVSNGSGPSPARARDPTPPSSPNPPAALLSRLGPSLRHLLLPDHWLLDVETVGRLARACPRLEQLGVAVGDVAGCLRVLGTRLPEMWALRFLRYTLKSELEEFWEDNEDIDAFLTMDEGWDNLRWLGMGDVVFRCRVSRHGGPMKSQVETDRDVKSFRRVLEKVKVAAVRDVEIWRMDNSEIV